MRGVKTSCGCFQYRLSNDLTGRKFGKLTVLKLSGLNKHGERIWLCKCDCGNTVTVNSYALTKGHTKSCGCYRADRTRELCCKQNDYFQEEDYYCGVFNDGSVFKVDKDDLELAKQYYWVKDANGYAVTSTPHKGKSAYRLHRLIMNAKDGFVVDHINHDKSDNRKQNLRICTISQNAMNMRHKQNRELPKGICINKSNGMYVAQITKNYKNIHIGSYKNLNEAIAARKKAEQALFGDYNYQEDQDFKNRVG